MVTGGYMRDALNQPFILMAKDVGPALERMEPAKRVAVIMALLALTLIGIFLVIFIMVGGHWVRRLARHRPRSGAAAPPANDVPEAVDQPQIVIPDEKSGDTMLLEGPSAETKIE